jgi:hypothetical protein
MNTATNDHIAQFVKGAHILTSVAVLILLVAAVPTSIVFLRLPPSPAETKIVGPVNISSPELSAIRDDIANLTNDIQRLSHDNLSEGEFKLLEENIANLDAKLSKLQKAKRVGPPNSVTPDPANGVPNR